MPQFDVAHIRQQNVDLIIIPLEDAFEWKPPAAKDQAVAELQVRSNRAGLAGTVVPVWRRPNGRMGFIAPRPWWPFFENMSLADVARNINKTLNW